ncbi:ATP/GTP-binding protein [Lyngbya aestuarii]|uniref:ATP/GTP-binding protein n=1 Tax=Lyngbya aestuarii TaxID=118322 RepID=UPI00403DE7F4
MESQRIVVTGTVGVGKSTFVKTVSELEVIAIERKITDQILPLKEKTTVALDFGQVRLSSQLDLHIYGTPGQSRFDFMWDILIHAASAYIVLVAANQPNVFQPTREILSFINQRVQIPMLIGLTHMDCPEALSPEEIMNSLGYINEENRPLFINVNPRDKTSTLEALVLLTSLLDS